MIVRLKLVYSIKMTMLITMPDVNLVHIYFAINKVKHDTLTSIRLSINCSKLS